MQTQVENSQQEDFIAQLDALIRSRKKMTSPLYQVILGGRASRKLLQQFVINRYPIKNFWTRNILGIASRIDDYPMRCELVENIFEEETGKLSSSKRHLESFVDFGCSLGLKREQVLESEWLPETRAVIEHNVGVCNRESVHFTQGVASVLLLMEGQPPIVTNGGTSMEAVMRDVYRLPRSGYDYFTHHASTGGAAAEGHVSELEDEHASTARNLLRHYCKTEELRRQAKAALERAIDLRHKHFDAIYERFYSASDEPFRWMANA